MPTEEGRRGDEKGDPAVSWENPACGREEDPVDGPELGWARRPPEHPELMPENEDLEVLRVLVSATLADADDEGDEGTDEQVDERPHQPILPGVTEHESGFPTPTRSVADASADADLRVRPLGEAPSFWIRRSIGSPIAGGRNWRNRIPLRSEAAPENWRDFLLSHPDCDVQRSCPVALGRLMILLPT
jgi:hypothetical protein